MIKPDQNLCSVLDQLVEKHYQEPSFDVAHLCRTLGMSRAQLFREFKACGLEPPATYIRNYRLERASSLLRHKQDLSIADIAYMTGFSSPQHFATVFRGETGSSPSDLRRM